MSEKQCRKICIYSEGCTGNCEQECDNQPMTKSMKREEEESFRMFNAGDD
jgi:hypothetical protein